jgi:hypothetical protein
MYARHVVLSEMYYCRGPRDETVTRLAGSSDAHAIAWDPYQGKRFRIGDKLLLGEMSV